MGDTNYKLRYLPLFYRDLEEKVELTTLVLGTINSVEPLSKKPSLQNL